MSISLQVRVSALEAEVKRLRGMLDGIIAAMAEREPAPTINGRKLCPKCGEKAAYHLHVLHCTGKKQASATNT